MSDRSGIETRTKSTLSKLLFGAALLAIAQASSASAQSVTIEIDAKPLDQALQEFSRATDRELLFSPTIARGKSSNRVDCTCTAETALSRMLRGTGLRYKLTSRNAFLIEQSQGGSNSQGNSASQGAAQASGSAPTEPSNTPIIVTANRREQILLEVDGSVSAYDQEFIETRNIDNIEDLILLSPSITSTDTDSFGRQNRIIIRGVARSGNSTATTGVYIDDIPLTFDAGGTEPIIRTFDLQRVEILRGPQGTLYGAGAMGGAIRYITNAPDPTEFDGQVRLDLSTTKNGDESYAIDGAINVPIVTDKVALRVSGSYEDTGGFVDLPNLADGPLPDANSGALESIRGVLRFTPSDELTIDLQAWYQKTKNEGLTSISLTPGGSDLVDTSQTGEVTTSDADFQQYSATIKYDFGWAEFISTSSFVETSANADINSLPNGLFATQTDYFVQELRLVSADSGPLTWSAGFFFQDGDSETTFANPFVAQDTMLERSQWALFGEVGYEILDGLDALAGLRYFENDGTQAIVTDSLFTGMSSLDGSFDEGGNTLLKFGLSYSGIDNINIYATATEGFRVSGVNVISPTAVGLGFPQTFESDSLWAYELGVKFNAAGGRLNGGVAVFYNDWENIQLGFADFPSGTIYVDNGGAAHIKGIEAEISFDLTDELTIGANGSLLEAEIDETVPGTSIVEGNRIGNVPEESAAFFITYTQPFSGDWDFVFTSNASYRGDTVLSDGRPLSESRWNLNARAAVRSENFEAALYVRNLANDDTPLTFLEGFGPFPASLTPQRPRTIGVELIGRF